MKKIFSLVFTLNYSSILIINRKPFEAFLIVANVCCITIEADIKEYEDYIFTFGKEIIDF